MTLKKLRRIIRKIEELRRRPRSVRSSELERLAKSLGRERKKKQTGEPMYVAKPESEALVETRAYAIPSHPGNLPIGTALSILNSLEGDVFRWREWLRSHGENGDV